MYKENLMLVIKYLKGEIDIYNGNYENTIRVWNEAWDEMIFTGYNPETVKGIEDYIKEQL